MSGRPARVPNILMNPRSAISNLKQSARAMRPRGLSSWLGALPIMTVIACLISPVGAQSAANFDTAPITPNANSAKKENNPSAPQKDAGPTSATPSRFVREADLDAYVQAFAAIFSIKDRATDPFGQLQDPDAKPVIKQTVTKTSRRVTQIQVTPFSDIIRMIKVTTIMPMEKCFLIGTRSIKEGQHFTINFRTKNITVEVVAVTSRAIEFRNLESGESSSLMLNLLPAGMTPGTKGITAPGMIPDLPNAPIELDGGNASNDTPHK